MVGRSWQQECGFFSLEAGDESHGWTKLHVLLMLGLILSQVQTVRAFLSAQCSVYFSQRRCTEPAHVISFVTRRQKALILNLKHRIKTFFQSAWRQNHMAAIFENKKSPVLPLSSVSLFHLSFCSSCSRVPLPPSPVILHLRALRQPPLGLHRQSLLGWTSDPVLHTGFVFMYCVCAQCKPWSV